MIRCHRGGMVLAGMVVTLLTLGSATPAFAVTMPLPGLPGKHHPSGANGINGFPSSWA
jgi:hypothetical protein